MIWACPHCDQWNSIPNDKTCHRCGTPQKSETEMITLTDYADQINNNPEHPLNRDNTLKELHEYERLLTALALRKIKPSSIIGTGYKNPKKAAIEWLNERITEHREIYNGTRIHPVIKANYDSECRKELRGN